MRGRLRDDAWSSTPLGPTSGWPGPLRTLVDVMLGSRQPMFVAWGLERTLLYNDGYAAILGSKHPTAFGHPFFRVWPEAEAVIGPLMARVDTGESIYMDDTAVFLDRNGRLDEAHFAFSCTPVHDEEGRVAGLFCPCTETTGQVLAERRSRAERDTLARLFEQAPGFMAMLRGPEHVFELVNPAFHQLDGHRDVAGKPVRDALPEVEGQGFFGRLDDAYASGEAFSGTAMKAALQRAPGGAIEERYLDLVYQPVRDAEGAVTGIFVEGSDVTERVRAEEGLRENKARLRLVAEGAKDHAIVTTDPAGTITSWSAGAAAIFGWSHAEAVGQPAAVIFTPEDRAAGADHQELATAAFAGAAPNVRWHQRRDGSRVFMNGSVHPLPADANGRATGFLRIARDET